MVGMKDGKVSDFVNFVIFVGWVEGSALAYDRFFCLVFSDRYPLDLQGSPGLFQC
jgi:hypothetical protein